MRCEYGATPKCKVHSWTQELNLLRKIVQNTQLKEEIKWGVPVYTFKSKNVLNISAFKEYCCLSFFKGVLLSDPAHILINRGNAQSERFLKFTDISQIKEIQELIYQYILEAIQIELDQKKVVFQSNPEPLPAELLEIFKTNTPFKEAFFKLTPGRQRGYIIYFSQPKQSATRVSRIQKYQSQILKGIGLHDK